MRLFLGFSSHMQEGSSTKTITRFVFLFNLNLILLLCLILSNAASWSSLSLFPFVTICPTFEGFLGFNVSERRAGSRVTIGSMYRIRVFILYWVLYALNAFSI